MPDYLHFRRDMAAIDMGQMLGPDMDRRYLAPRSVDYSPETGVSTLTLRAILPAEFRERVTALAEKERERERIRGLFCG
jgi:hypothetical protein